MSQSSHHPAHTSRETGNHRSWVADTCEVTVRRERADIRLAGEGDARGRVGLLLTRLKLDTVLDLDTVGKPS